MLFKTIHSRKLLNSFEKLIINFITTDYFNSKGNGVMCCYSDDYIMLLLKFVSRKLNAQLLKKNIL